MATFTPGPWSTRDAETYRAEIVDAKGDVLARVTTPRKGQTTNERQAVANANARLMAAVPELLACVQYMEARLALENPNDGLLHDCRAALAKAAPEGT